MQFNLDVDIHSYAIRAYRQGEIAVTVPVSEAGDHSRPMQVEAIAGSVIISPATLIRDWPPDHVGALQKEHLEAITNLNPEVILLGTGERLNFPDPEILAVVQRRQIGIEVMDTAAACRTYNILMAEGRRVAAGLINPNNRDE